MGRRTGSARGQVGARTRLHVGRRVVQLRHQLVRQEVRLRFVVLFLFLVPSTDPLPNNVTFALTCQTTFPDLVLTYSRFVRDRVPYDFSLLTFFQFFLSLFFPSLEELMWSG